MNIIKKIESEHLRADVPKFRAGDTVKVHTRIIEGEKERIQVFQGVVHAPEERDHRQHLHRAQGLRRRRRGTHLPPARPDHRPHRSGVRRHGASEPHLLPAEPARQGRPHQDQETPGRSAFVQPERLHSGYQGRDPGGHRRGRPRLPGRSGRGGGRHPAPRVRPSRVDRFQEAFPATSRGACTSHQGPGSVLGLRFFLARGNRSHQHPAVHPRGHVAGPGCAERAPRFRTGGWEPCLFPLPCPFRPWSAATPSIPASPLPPFWPRPSGTTCSNSWTSAIPDTDWPCTRATGPESTSTALAQTRSEQAAHRMTFRGVRLRSAGEDPVAARHLITGPGGRGPCRGVSGRKGVSDRRTKLPLHRRGDRSSSARMTGHLLVRVEVKTRSGAMCGESLARPWARPRRRGWSGLRPCI